MTRVVGSPVNVLAQELKRIHFPMQSEMEFKSIYRDQDIEIRPLKMVEAPLLLDAVRASHREISTWQGWCVEDYGLEHANNFLRMVEQGWVSETSFDCSVLSLHSGQVIGSVAINQINRLFQMGEIGYWTRTGYTGQGLAVRAALAIAHFAFDQLQLTRLEIVMQETNLRSQRVAEKVGASFDASPAIVWSITASRTMLKSIR